MNRTTLVFSALSIGVLCGCDPNPPVSTWDVTYTNGSNITEEATSDYAALNYSSASDLYGIEPSNLQAIWKGALSVAQSDNPETPNTKPYVLSVQSDAASTSILVNGTEIAALAAGDHSVSHSFPEGGSRDFPSKNDKVLWKPRHLWPPEGYYFFHIPILALIG